MDRNEARKSHQISGNDQGSPAQKPEELLQFMTRSTEFIKELMEENERLRYRVVQLQEENLELDSGKERGQRREILMRQINKLKQERDRLLAEYKKVEEKNKDYASRYVEIEDENNNLANLYVCSFQLHSTLDFKEVIQIIMEIIINLIGGENYGILLLDDKTQTLKPVAMEGIRADAVKPIPVGEGVIGRAVLTGENYYSPDLQAELPSAPRDVNDPMVCIPLMIKDQVIGVIVLYKLLPQKNQFANVDYELFTLLAGHAATAIFSSRLYSEAKRKLDTIKGFVELLTSSER